MESEFISPVYAVRAIPVEKVISNDYNPNKVAPPEMRLLELSIWEDGYTQPIVTYYDAEKDLYIVVDGFHRYTIMKTSKRIYERERGLLPVVTIDKELGERIASTIRHNRARGTHNVDLMSNIVAELHHIGKSDGWIAKKLGMDADEVLRLKQIGGLAELFRDKEFSMSWEVTDNEQGYEENLSPI
jgi:ParB-like chromosome segregation protein Spo0J